MHNPRRRIVQKKDGAAAKSLSAQGKALEAECKALNNKSSGMRNNAKDYSNKTEENKRNLSNYQTEIYRLNKIKNEIVNRRNDLQRFIEHCSNNRPTFEVTSESVRLGGGLSIETLKTTINPSTTKFVPVILSVTQFNSLTNVDIENIINIVGFAEKSALFKNFVTSNDSALRAKRWNTFEGMAKLEAKDSGMNRIFEPIWEKIAWLQEKADGGHSLHRHGPELSEVILNSRLTKGITPTTGEIKTAPPASTKFTSYKDWVLSRNNALDEISRINNVDLTAPPAGGLPLEYRRTIEYSRPIDEGFAGMGTKLLLFDSNNSPILTLNGNHSRGYSTTYRIDGITRTFTLIRWNQTNQSWQVIQHFPVGKDWNNTTKSYLPGINADSQITIP